MQNYDQVVSQAQQDAATPYQPFTGQLVAPVNQQQTTGINAINAASGVQDADNAQATGLAGASAAAINPTQYSGAALAQFESPYQSDVVNTTLGEINNQNQQQAASLEGNSISAGAFGGDRAGVAQAALAGQQDIATNATVASLNNQNFQNAQSEFNNQQTTDLGAQQNTAARQLAASQQLGTLGQTEQTEDLNEANAQTNAGTLQQQTTQAQDTANYNQYLQQLAYPFQTTGWLANIVEGIGSQSGGTTTGQTQQQSGNTGSTIAGGLLGLGSFLASGGRVTYANGGGLGGGVLQPAFDPTQGVPAGLGGGSWVPTPSLPIGHTMPQGSSGAAPGQTPAQQGQNMAGIAKGIQGLGNAFSNTSAGDAVSDAVQDSLDDLNRGGRVPRGTGLAAAAYRDGGTVLGDGGVMRRPHYDDGGGVTGLVFDPDALNTQVPDTTPLAAAAATNPATALGFTPAANGVLPPADVSQTASAPGLGAAAAPQPSPAPALAAIDQATAPRGIRNNNPGNLIDNAWTQSLPGYTGSDGRFATFNTPQAGSAALDQNLQSYASKGVSTPLAIASKWAPAGDGDNNPTAYAGFVASKLGVGINDPIDMTNPAVRSTVASAITQFENGTGASIPASASSYADSPAGGGLGAAGVAGAPVGASASPPSGAADEIAPSPIDKAIGATGAHHKGLAGLDLSDSTRLGLLAAGLGIMGGKSLNPWQNIGQGGLEGLQTMVESSKNQASTGLARAQTKGVETENAIKQGQLDLMMSTLKKFSGLGAPSGSQAPAATSAAASSRPSSPTAPASAIAPSAPSAGSAAPANPQVQLDPNFDPRVLREKAFALAASLLLANTAKQYSDAANQIETQGYSYDVNGNRVPLPGFNQVKAGAAAAVARAEGEVKNELAPAMSPSGVAYLGGQNPGGGAAALQGPTIGGTPPAMEIDPKTAAVTTSIPAAPKGGGYPVPDVPAGAKVTGIGEGAKELAKADGQFSDMVGKAPVLDQGIARFQSLAQAFKLFQSGSTTEKLQAGAAIAQSYGYPDLAKRILGGDPAAVQWVGKEGIQLTLDTLKAANPRFAQSEFQALANKGTPNAELLPQANHELIAEGLGLMERNRAFVQDWQKAQTQGWQSPSAFYGQWSNANPLGGFIRAAQRQIGNFKGMDLPPSSEWTQGVTYVAPSTMNPQQADAFAKRGIKPGQMFKFNGRDSSSPIQPIAPGASFSAQLGQ
ncbi:MAG: hypothetical protein WDN46_07775 [Methylocella sp.]